MRDGVRRNNVVVLNTSGMTLCPIFFLLLPVVTAVAGCVNLAITGRHLRGAAVQVFYEVVPWRSRRYP